MSVAHKDSKLAKKKKNNKTNKMPFYGTDNAETENY